MAIPTTFAPVKPQDFTLDTILTHKRFTLQASDLATTSSGYYLLEGIHYNKPTPIGSNKANNDPVNSLDGSYQSTIWKSVDVLYYRYGYDKFATFEHNNQRFTEKYLTPSASILSIPYLDYGESIKPGSVQITSSIGNFRDDIYGNLYNVAIDTGSFADKTSLTGYWGFNDQYRHLRFETGLLRRPYMKYQSHTFSPPSPSIIKNIEINRGVTVSGSRNSGLQATFDSNSYILTNESKRFNYANSENFTVSFWIQAPPSQSIITHDDNILINKNGVVFEEHYGMNPKLRDSDVIVQDKYQSGSFLNKTTNIYPYKFSIYNQNTSNNGKLVFSRSNGIRTYTLTSSASLNDSQHHHVCLTKSGSLYTLYIDGQAQDSGSFLNRDYCINDHSLMFGALDTQFTQGYSGSLDEIRFYEYPCSTSEIASLASTQSLYQTANIGNVFYKKGNIVISSLDPNYQDTLQDPNVTVTFKSTHTIYQYEALCRVKKGSFNLSLNPTARIHPQEDLLLPDMTGSLLKPYATTIGLYNDKNELVAIGKLGQPIQMRDDVDLNFVVRFDI